MNISFGNKIISQLNFGPVNLYSCAKNFNESKDLPNLEPLKMKNECFLGSRENPLLTAHLVPKDERSLSVAGIN